MHAAVAELEREPDAIARFNIDRLTASARVRRHVRSLLRQMEQNGADVRWHEVRGLRKSVFLIRIVGTGAQLAQPMRYLITLGEDTP